MSLNYVCPLTLWLPGIPAKQHILNAADAAHGFTALMGICCLLLFVVFYIEKERWEGAPVLI